MEKSEVLVAGKYILKEKIGKGSFGQIYHGINKETKEEVAIKLVLLRFNNTRSLSLRNLSNCSTSQKYTKSSKAEVCFFLKAIVGIPKLHWVGVQGEFNVMIIDLLGSNLEELRIKHGNTLSLKTVLLIGEQIVLSMPNVLDFKIRIYSL